MFFVIMVPLLGIGNGDDTANVIDVGNDGDL